MSLQTLLGDKYKENMTAEEIASALESVEPANYDGYIKKTKFDTTASELAEWKRKYKEKLTEEEQKAQTEKEAQEQREALLKELQRKVAVSENSKKFLALGYEEKLATQTAEAMADGNFEAVFANQAKFIEAQRKAIIAEQLKNTPAPPAGGTPPTEGWKKMTLAQRQALYNKDPEGYKQLERG